MATEQWFYLDSPASRHELRDLLTQTDVGFEAQPDWEHTSGASTRATDVTFLDDLSYRSLWPDNGVSATRALCFRLRDPRLDEQYHSETIRGVLALLSVLPDSDAYLTMYDAAIPALIYKNRRLVLSQRLTQGSEIWDAENQPYRKLVDLPYTIEPIGPWAT